MTVNISVTSTDFDALSRVAYAEAHNVFTRYKTEGYSDADATAMSYGMVIDIIINRVASEHSFYGTTITDVIDRHTGAVWQFSAVGLAGDSWTDLAAVGSPTLSLIEDYIIGRASGEPSVVGKATDYLNPTVPSALPASEGTGTGQGWGIKMKNMIYFGAFPSTMAVRSILTAPVDWSATWRATRSDSDRTLTASAMMEILLRLLLTVATTSTRCWLFPKEWELLISHARFRPSSRPRFNLASTMPFPPQALW